MKNKLLIISIMLITFSVSSQDKNAKTEFKVDGICELCKEQIESVALKTKGVKTANWNMETHILSLVINEKKTNLDKIKKAISKIEAYQCPMKCEGNKTYSDKDTRCPVCEMGLLKSEHVAHKKHNH
ncbi:MAG: cation transporter [Urechidicola sp.]|nr:cation transporter [Urechidicola sp.]